jgi:hypothetical protein
MPLMPLLMLMPIEPTSLFGQPFPECCAFHRTLLDEDIRRASSLRDDRKYCWMRAHLHDLGQVFARLTIESAN